MDGIKDGQATIIKKGQRIGDWFKLRNEKQSPMVSGQGHQP
jgi:hypothetical protein